MIGGKPYESKLVGEILGNQLRCSRTHTSVVGLFFGGVFCFIFFWGGVERERWWREEGAVGKQLADNVGLGIRSWETNQYWRKNKSKSNLSGVKGCYRKTIRSEDV